MIEPISLISLSLQVGQILTPIVKALGKAHRNRNDVHQSLYDLHSDLGAVISLTENIHQLFSVSSFVKAVLEVQKDSNVNLVSDLERALQSCSREAGRLGDPLDTFSLQIRDGRYERTKTKWRLDRRLDDIDRLKRNFQDHKSSIQLAFQILTT